MKKNWLFYKKSKYFLNLRSDIRFHGESSSIDNSCALTSLLSKFSVTALPNSTLLNMIKIRILSISLYDLVRSSRWTVKVSVTGWKVSYWNFPLPFNCGWCKAIKECHKSTLRFFLLDSTHCSQLLDTFLWLLIQIHHNYFWY